MSLTSAYSPVTNGEVLKAILSALRHGHLSGENELCTTSGRALFDTASSYLREKRGIDWGWVEDGASLTPEVLQESIAYLISRLKAMGVLLDWKGGIKHHRYDIERLCLAKGYEHYELLDQFLQLVNAQSDRPEFPKAVQMFGAPDSLLSNRFLIHQALVASGEDLRGFSFQVHSRLDLFDPETPFSPRNSRERALAASYQLAWLILRLRAGQPKGVLARTWERVIGSGKEKPKQDYWKPTSISTSEVAVLILRIQIAFAQARALWWTETTNALVAQRSDIRKVISRRRGDTAVKIFYEELARQQALEKERRAFNNKTGGRLNRFVNRVWINAPFSRWEKPPKLDKDIVAIVAIPSFRSIRR